MADTGSNGHTGSFAAIIDAVRWDYDPESDEASPLMPAERYFRDFPWEPEEVFESRDEEED